jgi:hypothetical protein
MRRAPLALAAIFFLVVTGSSVAGQAQGTTEQQRRECERSGGYWNTAAGYCKVGS